MRVAALFYGALLAVALLWGLLAGRSLLYADAEAAATGLSPPRDVALGVAVGLALVWLSGELSRRTHWGEALSRALGELLGPLDRAQCAVLALLSGVAEEAFFRGALQPALGWVAASVVFGLAHFAPRRDLLPWTGLSLAAGFLLGGLFEWTGNLVAPVLTHAVVNGVNLRILATRYVPR